MSESLEIVPELRRNRGDVLILSALLLLSGQGVLNYFLNHSSLAAWKQVVVVGCYWIILFRLRTMADIGLLIYVVLAALFLIVAGSFEGVPIDTLLFNIFYYIAWLPFYLAGRTFNLEGHGTFVRRSALVFIVTGAIGLLIQLYTPYLDFLKDQEDAEVRAQFRETQRFAFIFVASTLVMPTMAGMYYLYLLVSKSSVARFCAQMALTLAVIPTGSLSGLIMLISSFGMTLSRLRFKSAFYFAMCLGLLAVIAVPLSSELTNIQIERMITNTSQTESNQGRIELWREAIDTILSFPIEQQVLGAGLGVTNANRIGKASYAHGESSFLQAMVEGGIVGLSLRLLPFYLLLRIRLPQGYRFMNLAFGLGLMFCCATAPLFGAFGVQCLLGFNAGLIGRHQLGDRS